MMTLPPRYAESVLGNDHFPHTVTSEQSVPLLASFANGGSEDAFTTLSAIFPLQTGSAKFWWDTTGAPFAQMLKRAFYPIQQQYRYLVFYYLVILPEFGPMPLPAPSSDELLSKFGPAGLHELSPRTLLEPRSEASAGTSAVKVGPQFQSYMTDDHSPIELSWLFDNEGGAVVRFAIDPVRRQMEGDPRGAMGLFEDLGRSNIMARGVDLEWCRICSNLLTLPSAPRALETGKAPEYPSQYFVGFDFSSHGIVMKAYFLPEMRATVTSTPKSALITSAIIALSTPTPKYHNAPDLITPWKRVLSFISSLPEDLTPTLSIVAVDCVPSRKNRVKIYARTPRTTLANIRRFFTLGRDPASTSPVTQRALEQVTMMWHLLFPTLANKDCDDVEPPCPQHPTGGLLWYYELRPGYSEPFPKIYLPVRHLCSSDEQVVNVMQAFYTKVGNFNAAERYARDVRETYTHRPLSKRAGIHTYITFAIKPDDVEVTSYFNPECYAPERESVY